MKKKYRWLASAGLAALTLLAYMPASAGIAAQRDEWKPLGSLPPGTWSLQADNAAVPVLYALGANGLMRSGDGGAAWNACNAGARMMRVVTPAPGQIGPATIYAATPGGLQRTTDNCTTWQQVGGDTFRQTGTTIRWLEAYPNNRSVLYAGIDGLGGLLRSTDNGATWQSASKGLPAGAWVTALTADPRRPEEIYVGARYTSRNHSPIYLFKSGDGGLTWLAAQKGMRVRPNEDGAITGLAWSGDALFASTLSDGLFYSTDMAASWKAAKLPARTTLGEPDERALNVRQTSSEGLPLRLNGLGSSAEGALFVASSEGPFVSLDGARSWQSFRPEGIAPTGQWISLATESGRVIVGTQKGIWAREAPKGVIALPGPTTASAGEAPPTPPPPPKPPTTTPRPTLTPTQPPTATPSPTPQPTPTVPLVGGPLPTDRVEPGNPEVSSYFPETGHTIKQGFRDYWLRNNGIRLLGYPLSEEFVENGVSVQYFERGRLDFRDGKVSLGRLGAELTEGRFFRTVPFFPTTEERAYFGPTGHSISGPFLELWKELGGLETVGYPISEAYREKGSEYQWFERARFEWHPFLPADKRVVLGQLGKEALQKRGWLR